MDVRAEVAVLVPVSIATQMCCRCSDASWERCAAAVLTWATRANAQLTALSIRQLLFIAPVWRPGGTQAAQECGPRRPGAQNWVGDGPELDGHPTRRDWGIISVGRGYVTLSLSCIHTEKVALVPSVKELHIFLFYGFWSYAQCFQKRDKVKRDQIQSLQFL